MATKVKLRQRTISKNRKSLYLDFYPAILVPGAEKPTRRLYLGIYLFDKPKDVLEKRHNKEALQIGEQIRQGRENQLNKPEVYTDFEKNQLKIKELREKDFTEYFLQVVNKKKGESYKTWNYAFSHYLSFAGGKLRFADLTEEFCGEYKSYLLSARSLKSKTQLLHQNTAAGHFAKFRSVIRMAYKSGKGYLQTNVGDMIEPIKPLETYRNYLTIEELNRLAKTECGSPILKRVALFSALTGLRYSDIQKLRWSEVEHSEEYGYSLQFRQKKTQGVERLPISEQAASLLGTPGEPDSPVFEGLKYTAFYNRHLFVWLGAAGITKDITFHNFRHTFATIQLSEGTDIYTVSKLLGHRSLTTTQIYTKVVDRLKREAADKIKLNL